MVVKWEKYTKGMKLKSGRYLICFKDESEEGNCFIENIYWLNQGDIVHDEMFKIMRMDEKFGREISPEKRFLASMLSSINDKRTIHRSGFYHLEFDGFQHFVIANDSYMEDDSYVMELPAPPMEFITVEDPFVEEFK